MLVGVLNNLDDYRLLVLITETFEKVFQLCHPFIALDINDWVSCITTISIICNLRGTGVVDCQIVAACPLGLHISHLSFLDTIHLKLIIIRERGLLNMFA